MIEPGEVSIERCNRRSKNDRRGGEEGIGCQVTAALVLLAKTLEHIDASTIELDVDMAGLEAEGAEKLKRGYQRSRDVVDTAVGRDSDKRGPCLVEHRKLTLLVKDSREPLGRQLMMRMIGSVKGDEHVDVEEDHRSWSSASPSSSTS